MRIPSVIEDGLHAIEHAAQKVEQVVVDKVEKPIEHAVGDAFSAIVNGGEYLSPQSAPPIRGTVADDVSLLNKTKVNRVYRPKTEADIQGALAYARQNGLKVSMAGARHTMGGQTLVQNGVLLDMTGFNKMSVDPATKTLHVQSGSCSWSRGP